MEYPKIDTLFERDKSTFVVDPSRLKFAVLGTIGQWEVTEKIDGMNIRIMLSEAGEVTFGGRTNAAQLPGDLVSYLVRTFTPERMQEAFFWGAKRHSVVLYGEGYGPGIQKNGGLYRPDKSFIAFDALVAGKWWLNRAWLVETAGLLGVGVVPYMGLMSLPEIVETVRVGFMSRLGARAAEGVVAKPIQTLYDEYQKRVIIKLKTRDFQPGKR